MGNARITIDCDNDFWVDRVLGKEIVSPVCLGQDPKHALGYAIGLGDDVTLSVDAVRRILSMRRKRRPSKRIAERVERAVSEIAERRMGMSRSEIVQALGLRESQWIGLRSAMLRSGEVEATPGKKSVRYFLKNT